MTRVTFCFQVLIEESHPVFHLCLTSNQTGQIRKVIGLHRETCENLNQRYRPSMCTHTRHMTLLFGWKKYTSKTMRRKLVKQTGKQKHLVVMQIQEAEKNVSMYREKKASRSENWTLQHSRCFCIIVMILWVVGWFIHWKETFSPGSLILNKFTHSLQYTLTIK